MIIRVLLGAIIIIMIVRFIVRFVMPFLQVSSMAQEKLRQMQQQMNDMQEKANDQKASNNIKQQKVKRGDYIDYEEV